MAINRSAVPAEQQTILADGEFYDFNNYKSGLNDNVLVVGGSGTGKTRSIVCPNLLQAAGSYIVSDPKGNLYDAYHGYLEAKGYRVERLDFVRPERSTVQYNFFAYIRDQTDLLRIAHMLCGTERSYSSDRFWDQSAEILMQCVISYLVETCDVRDRNLGRVIQLLRCGTRHDDGLSTRMNSGLDDLLSEYEKHARDSMAVRCYQSVRMNPGRTWNCIVSTALSRYAAYDTRQVRRLLQRDTVCLGRAGKAKTAIFVVVSDTDRSMDIIANIFFTQAMQELCRVADAREDSRLRIPVRFVLDDFATNVHIDEFPRMISSIRSRGISTMLMIQAEAQLESGYGEDAGTIISNCDSYVYLGGNDIGTAERVGRRCDLPMLDILNMPVGTCWVFRRGQAAHKSTTFALEPFERARWEALKEGADSTQSKAPAPTAFVRRRNIRQDSRKTA